MVCKTVTPIKPMDAWLPRIFKISNTLFDRFLSHPQLHYSSLIGKAMEK